MTGNNKGDELIYWHTMYPGGLRSITRAKMFGETPEKMIMRVVKGMLPHNKLGAQIIKKVKIYRGSNHPHEAQQPEELKF
jgi:large subunit ribosomal protein L13